MKKQGTNMNKVVVLVLCCLLLAVSNISLAAAPLPARSAVEVIEKFDAVLLECLKRSDELGYSGRYALLEPIMKKSFFYSLMVRKSTGSYWKTMSEDQKKELLDKYIIWSVGFYADRFTGYKGQQFKVISSEPVRSKYMRVTVRIKKVDKPERRLAYLLMEDRGSWRIIDIKVKGVSQLSLTRAQFKSVLKKDGFTGLLKIIDEKIKAFNHQGNG